MLPCYNVAMLQCYTNFLYKLKQCQLSPLTKGEDIFSKHEELFQTGEEEWLLKCFYKSVTM